jgi:8-oxo-dGTP pyrophosphatase MutT (NUDIX family)
MTLLQDIWPQKIVNVLSEHERSALQGQGKPSAVLVPLFWKEGKYQILLTKRTQQVEHHKGEISFPGGAQDAEDASLLHTVLREAEEEIGLASPDAQILGMLDDTITLVSDFVITPFVGWIPYPYPYRIHPVEIEEILEIPLEFFLLEQNHWEGSFCYQDRRYPSHFYQWKENRVVWGATARIIHGFCDLLRASLSLEDLLIERRTASARQEPVSFMDHDNPAQIL